VAGLQFAFTLPYKGYVNVAPLYYQEWNHNSFLTPAFTAPYPGIPAAVPITIRPGRSRSTTTWISASCRQACSISRSAAAPASMGRKERARLPASSPLLPDQNRNQDRTRSPDIRRRQGALGQKYSQLVQLFVAYRYWENIFGHDNNDPANKVCFTAGVNNRSCAEKSVYSGITVKF